MKKTLLTLAIAVVAQFSYAQFSTSSGNTTTSDNVGIGTTTPDFSASGVKVLTIAGSSVRGMLLLQNSNTGTNGAAGTIQAYNGATFLGSVDIFADGATNSGAFQFYTVNAGSNISAMRITKEGNIGIGTIDPSLGGTTTSRFTSISTQTALAGAYSSSQPAFALNPNSNGSFTMYDYASGGYASGITQKSGNVGIGITTPDAKLTVNGTIHAKQVNVDLNVPGPDYVFKKGYKLKTLPKINRYIILNKHLPEIPSAKSMEQNGINVSELNMKLLQKVEELTLYLIEKDKQVNNLQDEMSKLKEQMAILTKALTKN